MVVKVKETFEKTRHVKNNDKFKKYILRGQWNVRYCERILSKKRKLMNSRLSSVQKGTWHQLQEIAHFNKKIHNKKSTAELSNTQYLYNLF